MELYVIHTLCRDVLSKPILSKLLKHGDLWVGRDVATAIRANLPEEEALSVSHKI